MLNETVVGREMVDGRGRHSRLLQLVSGSSDGSPSSSHARVRTYIYPPDDGGIALNLDLESDFVASSSGVTTTAPSPCCALTSAATSAAGWDVAFAVGGWRRDVLRAPGRGHRAGVPTSQLLVLGV